MTIPWPGQPDPSVGSDPGQQLTQGFQVMVRQLGSLERVITTQTATLERALNAQQRFQMAGQPQLRQDVLQSIAGAGGNVAGARQTQVSPMGALSSLENLRTYGAQQLGQWIAGTPLYEMPSQGGGGGAGGTPVGAPSSLSPGGANWGGGGAPGSGYGTTGAPPPGSTPVGTPSSAGGPPGGRAGGSGGYGGGGGGGPAGPPGGPGGGPPGGGGAGGGGGFGQGGRGAAILQQVGARVAMSGGSLSGLGQQLRNIPGIGLAIDTANSIANTYLNQREAGRVYQETEGGSNLSAQTERLHSLIYQASMFGLMPSGAAAQAFGQVTAMGYNQAAVGEGQQAQNRQSALNFIYGNYTKTGMDVNQSVQILSTASQDANINLQNLGDTLNALSASAGQAGANAEVARNQFNAYFQAAINQGAGNAATGIAGGISSMQASMGKQFAGVNLSGLLSQQNQYLLSGMSGINPNQLQYIQRNNPAGYNQLLAGQQLQILTNGGLMSPQMQSSLKQMIARAGGGNALMSNPDLTQQVAQQFLNQWQIPGGIDENLWTNEINALTGSNMNSTQALQWVVSQFAGINPASHNSSVTPGATGTVAANNIPGGTPKGQYGLAQGHGVAWGGLESLLTAGHMGNAQTWQQVLQGKNGPAANAYLSQEQRTGQRNPVLEALLQNTNSGDQVMVQTASGARVMSIADAMKYYPNELASGQVEFFSSSGQALGNTGGLTHGLINPAANVAAEEKQKAGSNAGVTSAAWFKAHPGAVTPAGGGQAVTITLSNEAQQLLKLLPSNNDQAAATSTVPANPWPGQASR